MKSGLWLLAAGAAVATLVVNPAAEAKTMGFRFDDYVWPGRLVRDSVTLEAMPALPALDEGPFHARAVADPDVGSWGPYGRRPSTSTASLGKVQINGARASLAFRVPPLAPGRYAIRVCNSPCTTRLRWLEGYTLNVAASPAQALLYERLDQVALEASDAGFAVRKLRDEMSVLSLRADMTAEAVTNLSARVRRLAERTRVDHERTRWPRPGTGAVVTFMVVLGGALGFALGKRNSGAPPSHLRRQETT